jgi:lysophospholipid acyltransferase (LPLAT)-like uncharacterized protein
VKRTRTPWWLPLGALLGAWLVRALGATWRFEWADHPEYREAEATGERFVYIFWHSGILPMAWSHRGRGIAVLVSQHHDGELIARLVHRLGYVTGRGSSTRAGDAGVREMLAWAERGRHLAVTPDGPRGPAETMKDGVRYLASRTGRRVVPIALGVHPAWVLRSWDRFRIPRPFARVIIGHGPPLTVPADEAARGPARDVLGAALADLTRRLRASAGEAAA